MAIILSSAAQAHEFIVKPTKSGTAADEPLHFTVESTHYFLRSEEMEKADTVTVSLAKDGALMPVKLQENEAAQRLEGTLSEPVTLVAPNSVDTLLVDLKARKEPTDLASLEALPLKAEVSFETEDFPGLAVPFSFNLRPAQRYNLETASKRVKIDGKLKEWEALPHTLQNLPGKSLNARFGLAYDEDYLYIAAEVEDDNLMVDTAEVSWQQDFIGFVVNAEPTAISASRTGQGWYENSILFTIAPETKNLPASVFYEDRLPAGAQYRCKVQSEGTYTLEAAIPMSYIKDRQGGNWRSIRFNMVVQDRDAGKENWPRYQFMPDWRGGGNFVGSGLFFR